MGIISTWINSFPHKLRGMAQTSASAVVATLVDEPGYDVCACDGCEFEEHAFVKNGGSWWENSKKRFIRSKQFASDTIEFTLWKNGAQVAALNASTYGDFYDFGSSVLINPYYKAFIIDWNLVQLAFGYGKYTVRTVHTSLGTPRTYDSWVFDVKQYTSERADGTVRIESYQNGVLQNGFDYTGINIYQNLWIDGKFWNKQPKLEETNYKDTNLKKHQIQAEIKYTYDLETQLLPSAVFNRLNEDELLSNDIRITDYNLMNQEIYRRKEVHFADFGEVEHHALTRRSNFVYKMEDRTENLRKRNISGDFGKMPVQPNTTSTLTCADAELEVNGASFTSIPSGNTYDLIVKDDLGAQVGSKIGSEWIVPAGAVASGVLLRWPIGEQYTSYRTGDTGDRLQSGYYDYTKPVYPELITELDWSLGSDGAFRLVNPAQVGANSNNLRFVDITGLQTFSATGNKDAILIDKLTGIGIIRKSSLITGGRTWNQAIDDALAFSIVVDGNTYNTWYLWSLEEANALFGTYFSAGAFDFTDPISAVPLLVQSGNEFFWSSTTAENNTANAFEIIGNPSHAARTNAKTVTNQPMFVFDARSLISAP